MSHQTITSAADFQQFCASLADEPRIGFDTEFVSEHTYRPVLCLLQVVTNQGLTVVDCLAVGDMRPFWEVIAAEGHETIVHAGRGEVVFCLEAIDQLPHNLFDVQLAAALVGLDYPAGLGNLLSRLLGVVPRKGETRTDWRQRPLSAAQVDYALEDVRHLFALRDKLVDRLTELDRVAWCREETDAWLADVRGSLVRERWRKVSGLSGLGNRELSIVRELWRWREEEAQRRNQPPRRVLRDDLIIELAKRKSADPKQVLAIRGMERGDLRRAAPELARAINHALANPLPQTSGTSRRDNTPQLMMLGQFLIAALSSVCRAQEVAPSLVGTADDVRALINYRVWGETGPDGQLPSLMQGWRAQVVGQLLDDLLQGRVAMRIADPLSSEPLAFERLGEVKQVE